MKTKLTSLSVAVFLNAIRNDQKRLDAFAISDLMQKITNQNQRCGPLVLLGLEIVPTNYQAVRKCSGSKLDFPQEKLLLRYICLLVLGNILNCLISWENIKLQRPVFTLISLKMLIS